ncbi:conjugative transposon protein TraN, partial [Prevotella corporis]|nr:conjugative transposon protein TraN [Prevotella corporis]
MALLATMGATATAQDINNGTPLMPNRPLSSGELFQG